MNRLSEILSFQDNYAIITKNQYTIIGGAYKHDLGIGKEVAETEVG